MPSAGPCLTRGHRRRQRCVGEGGPAVERAVARLVQAARPVDDVRHVQAAGLRPGELASLTAPSLFGGGSRHRAATAPPTPPRTSPTRSPAWRAIAARDRPGPHPRRGAKGKHCSPRWANGAPAHRVPEVHRLGERMQFIRGEFRQAGRTIEESRRAGPASTPSATTCVSSPPSCARTGRGHHRGHRPDRGGPPTTAAGPRRAGSPWRTGPSRGAWGTRLETAAVGAGGRGCHPCSSPAAWPRECACWPGGQRPRASRTRPWPPRSARPPGRWTGVAAAAAGLDPGGVARALAVVARADAQVKGEGRTRATPRSGHPRHRGPAGPAEGACPG